MSDIDKQVKTLEKQMKKHKRKLRKEERRKIRKEKWENGDHWVQKLFGFIWKNRTLIAQKAKGLRK